MTDIVERLRVIAETSENIHALWINRAADEIERLRAALVAADVGEVLQEAKAEIERLREELKQ